ncbi:GntR family transcriptional regulator [Fertoebacter nigrum]|uniref:GntR family transcriptional regulator n=1 Tax=Fertoeibacter niger TaxID=2656921 RepID=A0A8X8GXX0_9RHOB|nr:GntR family transcriptional regulator [Fertoeibacter niger]NUB43210.1 GntR family transcriptional regulator [Fertoeibacter niger]
MTEISTLRSLDLIDRPSVADQIFDALHAQVLSLQLPPGAKISEVDVARIMGASRQPVRDAFYRLSKLGFLLIRPQRATTIALISTRAVMQARFIRTALEAETMRAACTAMTPADHAALDVLIDQQRAAMLAGDRLGFHQLDDQFHREICERAGLGFAWDIIRESKAHMDRVRYLSLSFASQAAFDDHVMLLDALKARDEVAAVQGMRVHLARILEQITRIRADHRDYFAEEDN